jgi:transcriptional regulator with XRE-family HTH domain
VRESSIAKHLTYGPDSAVAIAIGAEVRRRRIAAGLSQAKAGWPLTRGFVSAVECGHVVPSLPALMLIAGHLGTDIATLLQVVKGHATTMYNPGHGRDRDTPPAGGSG